MFYVNVESHFSAAHQLRGYKGQCEKLHGHNWRVKATVKSNVLDNIGMALDFTVLKQYLREITGMLDHNFLNELPFFHINNPSAENIAQFIFEELEKKVSDIKNVTVYRVEVWESEKSSVIYEK